MYGRPPGNGGAGGGGWRGQPSQPPRPGYFFPPNLFVPNPSFPIQQNPNLFDYPNPNFQFQSQVQPPPRSSFIPEHVHQENSNSHQSPNSQGMDERVKKAVIKARKDLIKAGEHVSSLRVSEAALATLQANSSKSLGVIMERTPPLRALMATENKINTFIHCFVGVQSVTTLYDLEVALCKHEGVKQFEDLEVGPLLKHPLIVSYFSLNPDVSEVFKITSGEITLFLAEFMDAYKSRHVPLDKFWDFIIEKKSAGTKEKLCVRIRSLSLHLTFILQAKEFQNGTVIKYLRGVRKKSTKTIKKRPLYSAEKKQLDKHFNDMCERVKSFSSADKKFSGKHTRFVPSAHKGFTTGKHIRFISSSSEYESSDEDDQDGSAAPEPSQSELPAGKNVNRSNRQSTCPYPSASEEMTRLGLKGEVDVSPHTSFGGDGSKSKRKHDDAQSSTTLPKKTPKRDKKGSKLSQMQNEVSDGSDDPSHSDDSIAMFVNTFKEVCRTGSADEVLQRILEHYTSRGVKGAMLRKSRMARVFSVYPFRGLLQVAVTSMKHGMWDSMYDKFQPFHHHGVSDTGIGNRANSPVCIEIESSPERDTTNHSEKLLVCESDVTIEDIRSKITAYLKGDDDALSSASSYYEKFFFVLNKFRKLESWLKSQFSVKQFESLGYGDFWSVLEENMHLFSHGLPKFLTGDMDEKPPLELSMLDSQFDLLLSQASQCLWENEKVDKQRISELLMRQFPLVYLKVGGSDTVIDIDGFMKAKKVNTTLKSVVFSETLLRGHAKDGNISTNLLLEIDAGHGDRIAMSKDAMKVFANAPMLLDLKLWSHWDRVFAPYLGSLIGWLLNEVKTEELLCLVTTCGKLVRVDHSATIDSFVNVLLQGNPFETAVKLLSLLVLYGGEKNVPSSLLKCHARQGFEVLIQNYKEINSFDKVARVVPFVSRFVLDCLGYLPVEFCHFAADILLTGLQPFVKDAPSDILSGCERIEQRLTLHRVGMSLGIVEWVEDKHKLIVFSTSNGSTLMPVSSVNPVSRIETNLSLDHPMRQNENRDVSCSEGVITRLPVDNFADSAELESSAARVIESIQREEFGMQPGISLVESAMLNKQHARLGRALHCLSQELYSQDSHFILELVQNADDNIYPETVEPTLTFILEGKGIVVLNNEHGFSADNIKALCDVGNSTKKVRNAGYIGKKGIGFKSVFRVTDAPEIHSNGFHIKFDITKGQIGFVLPTAVPPCDIGLYTRLASLGSDCTNWNTCIVLPFKSNLLEKSGEENVISMFADLHPSLLLFLHRLHCIKFRNMLSDSVIVMRKEVVGNGIVNVSFGEEKLTCFVVSRKLLADTIRPDIQTTEISIAFTLQETLDGGYKAFLDQQPVFAFLPLRKYGLKFILQGDFVLPSSREEVDGDSSWNQWLLSEFPSLFVSAERSFCDLPCFKENPAKGVTAYISFVPLVGDVHGFFSSLPRMILSKLRTSNCLILEGEVNEWVPPCKVLRNWTQEARNLLSDSLLRQHLGAGFLHKDIVLPDLLARALGIEEYGIKVLFQVISSLSSSENGLKLVGLEWLCSWLNAVYTMPSNGAESLDLMKDLKKIPFIPLSDGKYGSLDEGAIWLHVDSVRPTTNDEYAPETFPILYSTLRTVNPALLSAAAALDTSCSESSIVDNVTRMLYRAGVQRLSAHQIVKIHILPFLSREKNGHELRETTTEYLAFLMFHLQLSCPECLSEKEQIMREVRENVFILTNHGYKRPIEFPIHFSKGFENPVDMSKLIGGFDLDWLEIEDVFLKHPINKSLSGSVLKWRKFFQDIGITDFVRILQVEKPMDKDLISRGSIVKDWVSDEFVNLLSRLSSTGDKDKCKYLLEVVDSLWDDYFGDKVTGFYLSSTGERELFDSSFIKILRDVHWLASSVDDELHCPAELFHDCEAVHSIFGDNAPYAVPKVRSERLLTSLGLRTQVTVDDALAILKVWRAKVPFNASLSQMSKFYAFIRSRMNTSERKVFEKLHDAPFVFVPYKTVASDEEVVAGVFLSSKEVFWHDSTGSMDQLKMVSSLEEYLHLVQRPFTKMLCSVYPDLHNFFVKECGVNEIPLFHGYVQILLQLSAATLPSQAAKNVFRIFLQWVDKLNSGSLRSEDIAFLKEGLSTMDYLVLPTAEDKWVSLNPSFGLICWCDDDKLKKEFKHFDNIKFLYFGQLNDEEKEILQTKVSILMRKLSIPSLSEVVTREAIYDGPTCSRLVASVVNWALPYAQRYVFSVHPDKYCQLSKSGFENLRSLQIVVVEKLFYRNVIKSSSIASQKKFDCSCLLEGNILYATQGSDFHSIFMEISHLLSSGTPDLHLANFLHMITTMAESGSTEEQTEFFILNSQKMPKLPEAEPVWSLADVPLPTDIETDSVNAEPISSHGNVPLSTDIKTGPLNSSSKTIDENATKKRRATSSNWPPTNWKRACRRPWPQWKEEEFVAETCETRADSTEMTCEESADTDPPISGAVVLGSEDADHVLNVLIPSTMEAAPTTAPPRPDPNRSASAGMAESEQVFVGPIVTMDPQWLKLTGRLGEFFAFKYFLGKHVGDPTAVKWVNETNETGLPYDIVVGEEDYIEVKASRSKQKDWFHITLREWQFAVQKRESFSVAHVVLSHDNTATVTVYRNPFRLVQLGKLQLALTISK